MTLMDLQCLGLWSASLPFGVCFYQSISALVVDQLELPLPLPRCPGHHQHRGSSYGINKKKTHTNNTDQVVRSAIVR